MWGTCTLYFYKAGAEPPMVKDFVGNHAHYLLRQGVAATVLWKKCYPEEAECSPNGEGEGQHSSSVFRYWNFHNILAFQLESKLWRWWGERWGYSFERSFIFVIYTCQIYSWWGKWADNLTVSKTAGQVVTTCNSILMADACSMPSYIWGTHAWMYISVIIHWRAAAFS